MAGSRRKKTLLMLLAMSALGIAFAWRTLHETEPAQAAAVSKTIDLPQQEGMIRLGGGEFLMGSPRPSPGDQRPVHRAVVKPFWMDVTHVTNREFGRFVSETHYMTIAERRGWSLVFDRSKGSWHEAAGVSWRHPTGAESSLAGKNDFPVVHVSWHDAVAYAAWAKKRLPTETEYEFAARGGLSDAPFAWGRELTPGNRLQANYWQGKFPLANLQQDGYYEVAPTKRFPPNAYGLYDIAGNVACWCADWYAADAYGRKVASDQQGPATGTERVLRGGSWHSTAEAGEGLRVGDRQHAPPDETSSRIGFRCVRDVK